MGLCIFHLQKYNSCILTWYEGYVLDLAPGMLLQVGVRVEDGGQPLLDRVQLHPGLAAGPAQPGQLGGGHRGHGGGCAGPG